MDDVINILTIFRDASPWVVLAGTVLGLVYLIIRHREKMSGNAYETAAHRQIEEIHSMLTTHCTEVATTLTGNSSASQQELALLNKIAAELINLNARTSTNYISPENSKLIILNQWTWCGSETAKLICNSISNNHFKGNEDLTARKVYRAWRKAAKDAQISITNFSGLKYPFRNLFDQYLPKIWAEIWQWALPLYHAQSKVRAVSDKFERTRQVEAFNERLQDLAERVEAVFAQIIEAHFRTAEDLDVGEVYACSEEAYPANTTSNPEIQVAEDEEHIARAAAALRSFDEDESDETPEYTPTTVESLVEDMKQEKTGSGGYAQRPGPTGS